MKAVILKNTGDVSQLVLEEIEIPTYAPDEVLIKVEAFSINPIEIKTRNGNRFSKKLLADKPSILGWDVSGTIEEVGKEVDVFRKGAQVFGMINFPDFGKTYAEYAVAKASDLIVIPDNIDFIKAAATPLAALTAFQALKYYGRLSEGKKVLIHAAGGGVGHFAVQIAKYFGSEVIVTCSEDKKDFVLELGADRHIDYKKELFEDKIKEVDVVFDLVGGSYIDRSLKILKPGGVIISIPTATNTGVEEKAQAKGCEGIAFKVNPRKKDMQEISYLLQEGIVKPFVSRIFHIDEIKEAHLAMEKGGTKGKIVVKTS